MATLIELRTELAELKAARTKIITGGQSYQAGPGGTFSMTRANLQTLNDMIKELECRIQILENDGGMSHTHAVFGGAR